MEVGLPKLGPSPGLASDLLLWGSSRYRLDGLGRHKGEQSPGIQDSGLGWKWRVPVSTDEVPNNFGQLRWMQKGMIPGSVGFSELSRQEVFARHCPLLFKRPET